MGEAALIGTADETREGMRSVRLRVPARAEYIALARLALSGLADIVALPEELLADLKLALTEAVSNSVRHAYADGTGFVSIAYELTGDALAVEVVDDGKGLRPGPAAAARGRGAHGRRARHRDHPNDRRRVRAALPAGNSRLAPALHQAAASAGLTLSTSTTTRRKLLVVFNRAPVSYTRDAEGKRIARRGGGGVVTALGGLLAHHEVTWVASAMTEEDRAVAAEQDGSFVEETAGGASFRLRLVAHDRAAYDRFYNVLANPTLWFVHHYLWGLGSAPDFGPELHEAWSDGYVPVNEGLAAAALEELDREPDAAVLFHDYHLYLAPRMVREARPEVVTSHFLHIPWPEPDYWHALPPELRVAVHEGLLANDVVGFHTERWQRAFLLSVERLLGARVDREAGTVEHLGRTTRTVAHPISVDPAEFDRLRDDPGVLEREAALVARRPERLVVRVDRTDPSKNIVRGFRAYALLLERHPELHATGRHGRPACALAAGHPGVRGLRRRGRDGGAGGERALRPR